MYIDLNTSKNKLSDLLQEIGFFSTDDEHILTIEKPGDGNMNVVIRAETLSRSFIIKQSREFVQKYQDIKAPIDRIDVEYQFYKAIENEASIAEYFPKVLAYKKEHHLLILEDLGNCKDMSFLYNFKMISEETISELTQITKIIHGSKHTKNYPENKLLRELNHQHIFVLPFEETNGFNLDEIQNGLQKLSLKYKKDFLLKSTINTIGYQYLSEGNTLIHGDYYPGSWMLKNQDIYVIDPEFSFLGFPEFDLGVLAAHIVLITSNKAYISTIINTYNSNTIDKKLVEQIAGIEIMRRIIGIAQLPLSRTLNEKEMLLDMAYNLIMP